VRRVSRRLLLGSLGLALAALLASSASTASASACKRWGTDDPSTLSHEHARAATTCFINRVRARKGRHRLDTSDQLEQASQAHTDYMRDHKCFDHQCDGEASLKKRLETSGYPSGTWEAGENIAYGGGDMGTPKAIFKAWMGSPGHRANILKRKFRDIGVGFAHGTPKHPHADGGTYTADFGYRHG
jgi:uncharacterized protein YkwD